MKIKYLLIIMLLIISCSCATQRGVVNLSPPLINKCNNCSLSKDLIDRIAKYWHYRKTNNPEASYKYEIRKLKGYKLDKVYKLYVMHMSKAKVSKIEIVNFKKYKEGICVNLKFYLKEKNILGKKDFYQQDCWMKTNNGWYHLLTNKLIFKF